MDGGCFMPDQNYGYVRATTMMNSKSSNDFRWSVRLTQADTGNVKVRRLGLGIASNELVQNELRKITIDIINYYDQNAIVYYPFFGKIRKGEDLVQTYTTRNVTSGDEIHFRFQPKLKKFLIKFVSQLF